jgi:hypothetical protein
MSVDASSKIYTKSVQTVLIIGGLLIRGFALIPDLSLSTIDFLKLLINPLIQGAVPTNLVSNFLASDFLQPRH